MIKHVWTIICKESKIDANTNNVSIIDAYENIQFSINTNDPKYKKGLSVGVPFNFEAVSLFFRDKKGTNGHVSETIKVLDPKGEKLGEFSNDVQFKEEHDRMRNILKFNTIAVTTSGTYLFQVFTNKNGKSEQVTTIPINIQVTVNGEAI